MLGRLSKWLVIMGQNCLYIRKKPGQEIIQEALDDDRILLTRDTRLIADKKVGKHLFIKSDHLEQQLIQVLYHFSIDPLAQAFQRCVRCNVALRPANFKTAGAAIPDHVHQTQETLAFCLGCNRYYWGATHKEKMLKRLVQIKQAINDL